MPLTDNDTGKEVVNRTMDSSSNMGVLSFVMDAVAFGSVPTAAEVRYNNGKEGILSKNYLTC